MLCFPDSFLTTSFERKLSVWGILPLAALDGNPYWARLTDITLHFNHQPDRGREHFLGVKLYKMSEMRHEDEFNSSSFLSFSFKRYSITLHFLPYPTRLFVRAYTRRASTQFIPLRKDQQDETYILYLTNPQSTIRDSKATV
jgi:hypothetical protein